MAKRKSETDKLSQADADAMRAALRAVDLAYAEHDLAKATERLAELKWKQAGSVAADLEQHLGRKYGLDFAADKMNLLSLEIERGGRDKADLNGAAVQ